MKVGLDIHGTIDKDPEGFIQYIELCLKWRVSVYIISGPPTSLMIKHLEALGKKYKNLLKYCHIISPIDTFHLVSVVEYLRSRDDVEMWQDNRGGWWCDEEIWWKSKSEICKELGIDVLIDNETRYQDHFKDSDTLFILYGGENEI